MANPLDPNDPNALMPQNPVNPIPGQPVTPALPTPTPTASPLKSNLFGGLEGYLKGASKFNKDNPNKLAANQQNIVAGLTKKRDDIQSAAMKKAADYKVKTEELLNKKVADDASTADIDESKSTGLYDWLGNVGIKKPELQSFNTAVEKNSFKTLTTKGNVDVSANKALSPTQAAVTSVYDADINLINNALNELESLSTTSTGDLEKLNPGITEELARRKKELQDNLDQIMADKTMTQTVAAQKGTEQGALNYLTGLASADPLAATYASMGFSPENMANMTKAQRMQLMESNPELALQLQSQALKTTKSEQASEEGRKAWSDYFGGEFKKGAGKDITEAGTKADTALSDKYTKALEEFNVDRTGKLVDWASGKKGTVSAKDKELTETQTRLDKETATKKEIEDEKKKSKKVTEDLKKVKERLKKPIFENLSSPNILGNW